MGLALHWPSLDADIPSLMQGVFGTKRWMAAQLGAAGGSATTPAAPKQAQKRSIPAPEGTALRRQCGQKTALGRFQKSSSTFGGNFILCTPNDRHCSVEASPSG